MEQHGVLSVSVLHIRTYVSMREEKKTLCGHSSPSTLDPSRSAAKSEV